MTRIQNNNFSENILIIFLHERITQKNVEVRKKYVRLFMTNTYVLTVLYLIQNPQNLDPERPMKSSGLNCLYIEQKQRAGMIKKR